VPTANSEAPEQPTSASSRVAIVGAGSWGTALAVQFARAGRDTVLWGRENDDIPAIAAARENRRYLPGVHFPERLQLTPSLARALDGADDVIVVVPSHGFRVTLEAMHATGARLTHVAWATKGFETDSGLLPHQVAAQVWGPALATAVLSGPTFAREVGAGLPSAITVASRDQGYALRLARAITSDVFRAYTSNDIIGVEVGGATKNVLAIGAGISDGLGFGANTRIALVTRGLMEMTRLGVALGARKETFMGLSGMGDLVLTCTDNQSRNRRFGLALAAGTDVETARREIGQVVEGYYGARAVYRVAARLQVEMPIVEQIYEVVYEGLDPREGVMQLMRRPITPE
jgi:glycerol-3-phosphate dehydrogenase (NAD(P)+)